MTTGRINQVATALAPRPAAGDGGARARLSADRLARAPARVNGAGERLGTDARTPHPEGRQGPDRATTSPGPATPCASCPDSPSAVEYVPLRERRSGGGGGSRARAGPRGGDACPGRGTGRRARRHEPPRRVVAGGSSAGRRTRGREHARETAAGDAARAVAVRRGRTWGRRPQRGDVTSGTGAQGAARRRVGPPRRAACRALCLGAPGPSRGRPRPPRSHCGERGHVPPTMGGAYGARRLARPVGSTSLGPGQPTPHRGVWHRPEGRRPSPYWRRGGLRSPSRSRRDALALRAADARVCQRTTRRPLPVSGGGLAEPTGGSKGLTRRRPGTAGGSARAPSPRGGGGADVGPASPGAGGLVASPSAPSWRAQKRQGRCARALTRARAARVARGRRRKASRQCHNQAKAREPTADFPDFFPSYTVSPPAAPERRPIFAGPEDRARARPPGARRSRPGSDRSRTRG